jgi:hypothetical protein
MTTGRAVAAPRRSRGVRLLDGKVLRGFNLHHHATVFVQRVDLGDLAGRRSLDAGPKFAARFLERFEGVPSDLVAELNGPAGAPFERALLEAILAIERSVARAMRRLDSPVFSRLLPHPRSARAFTLVWECHSGRSSRVSAQAALAGLLELIPASLVGRRAAPPNEEFATIVAKLERRSRRRRWSPATAALALAAKNRGIPCESLAGAYLRLGDGVLQQVVSPAEADGAVALDLLFPAGSPVRVPVALVLGERGAGAIARNLDALLRATGRGIGLSTRALTTISGRSVDPTSLEGGSGARFLLGDPRVEMLVASASPARIVKRGLRLDRTAVTAVLDPIVEDEREVHVRGIDVAVAATAGPLVVSADGPLALRLAVTQGRERLLLVSLDGLTPGVTRHLSEGGSAVLLALSKMGETIELRHGNETLAAIRVSSLSTKSERVSELRLRRAMFATALAFGLGLTGEEIVAAVEKRRFLER